nr:uncharacterized protein LOC112004333 [Quercus suber]
MPLAQVNTSANANSSEPRPVVEEFSMEAHVLEPNLPRLSPPVQSDSTSLDVSSSSMRQCVKMKNGCPSSNASSLLDPGRHLSLNSHPMKTRGKTKVGLLHYSTPPSIPTEPHSLKSALRHLDWVVAMKEELQDFHDNHTWTLVPHHPSMNVIGPKWVYRTKLKADGSLERLKARPHGTIVLLLYVDDIILTGSNEHFLQSFVRQLSSEFAMKDLGPLHYFLGIEVVPTPTGLFLSHGKYAQDLLQCAHMSDCNAISTPMALKSTIDFFPNPSLYRNIVGALQYLTITCPDLSYTINSICQHMHALIDGHMKLVKRILCYVHGAFKFGLHLLHDSTLDLYAFSDAD